VWSASIEGNDVINLSYPIVLIIPLPSKANLNVSNLNNSAPLIFLYKELLLRSHYFISFRLSANPSMLGPTFGPIVGYNMRSAKELTQFVRLNFVG